MSGFDLVPVDGGELIHLPPGETVLGRGPFLGVSPLASLSLVYFDPSFTINYLIFYFIGSLFIKGPVSVYRAEAGSNIMTVP